VSPQVSRSPSASPSDLDQLTTIAKAQPNQLIYLNVFSGPNAPFRDEALYLLSRKDVSTEDGVAMEGNIRLVSRNENGTVQTYDSTAIAACTGDSYRVGRLLINGKQMENVDTLRAPKLGGPEPTNYAIWRELCRGYISAENSPITMACVQPVPVVAKQLSQYAAAHPEDREKAIGNVNYLVSRYCRIVYEPISVVNVQDLGSGCVMQIGKLRGEWVYTSSCQQ
jgi:hypothetical protein